MKIIYIKVDLKNVYIFSGKSIRKIGFGHFLSIFEKSNLLSGKKYAKYAPYHNGLIVFYKVLICHWRIYFFFRKTVWHFSCKPSKYFKILTNKCRDVNKNTTTLYAFIYIVLSTYFTRRHHNTYKILTKFIPKMPNL